MSTTIVVNVTCNVNRAAQVYRPLPDFFAIGFSILAALADGAARVGLNALVLHRGAAGV